MYDVVYSSGETERFFDWNDLVSDMRFFHHPFNVKDLVTNRVLRFNDGNELF